MRRDGSPAYAARMIGLFLVVHSTLAGTIVVDETTCTLVDAITAANTDAPAGGCPAGSGADSIRLATDVELTEVVVRNPVLALPLIESDITVALHLLQTVSGHLSSAAVALQDARSAQGSAEP